MKTVEMMIEIGKIEVDIMKLKIKIQGIDELEKYETVKEKLNEAIMILGEAFFKVEDLYIEEEEKKQIKLAL